MVQPTCEKQNINAAIGYAICCVLTQKIRAEICKETKKTKQVLVILFSIPTRTTNDTLSHMVLGPVSRNLLRAFLTLRHSTSTLSSTLTFRVFPETFFATNLFCTSFAGKVGLNRLWNLLSSTVVMVQLLTVVATYNFKNY